jgi:hypothetical protein
MKLSNRLAKLTCIKSNAVRVLAAATLAGALFTAAAPAAQAQRIVFGVGFGGPRFYRPAPPVIIYGPGYYGYRHFDGWRDRDDFYRHHDRDRDRDFRDHDRFDHR